MLNEILSLVNYKITNVWVHQWDSYNGAICFDSSIDGYEVTIVYDYKKNLLIEIRVLGPEDVLQDSYIWNSLDYFPDILEEAEIRNVTHYDIDGVHNYIPVELGSIKGIIKGLFNTEFIEVEDKDENYGEEEVTHELELDIPYDILITLTLEANKRDITLNSLVNEILSNSI